ncbi:sensor histidine kinase [Dictyobacter formicarum]|uniref:histidine kinase n=1 Tax=Dictyobacter formicarum TaxID=2778368 RepID=A0ABQ3VIR0_9CHLR|nr:ATP-binding protein [Dictyobacter formicarum]GHO86090.1 hypothetical protein KSZ_40960 [Dictyobacter formicarum]
MRRHSRIRWSWPHTTRRHAQKPEIILFRGLRIRLTLWYCGILGIALVLFGTALYFGAQYFLLAPIKADATGRAQAQRNMWLHDSPAHACMDPVPHGLDDAPPHSFQGFAPPRLMLCFDQNGNLLTTANTNSLPATFLDTHLVKAVLQTDQSASDVVDGGGTVGSIYRYALLVTAPDDGTKSGVVLVGETIQPQMSALNLLLVLLLSIGGVALLGAGVGGLFLADRALLPARQAWLKQQRFIADASHELRTPLTLLRADADVLLRGRKHLDEEDTALLDDIIGETTHMTRLAANLLTLARLDSSNVHHEQEVIDLTELATRVVHRVQSLAEQQQITVQITSSQPWQVLGDPVLLEQAILGLLDNAIKYNHAGGQVNVRTMKQNGQVILEIQDTGRGIAAEHLPHLGERFYRVDKARARSVGGTGLGLSIAQESALAHGGQLHIQSASGQGTTVRLTLPVVQGHH